MIYDTLDELPLKKFLKILDTGNYTMLTDEKHRHDECKEIWKRMEDEHARSGNDSNFAKSLDLNIRIDALKYKYDFILTAVHCLKFDKDDDIISKLKKIGYKVSEENYMNDLEAIDNNAQAIVVKIKKLESKMPTEDEKDNKNTSTIDRVIIGYCSIAGLTFDTNKITYTQFYALKSTAEDKIKAVEESNAKLKAKNRTNGRRNNNAS